MNFKPDFGKKFFEKHQQKLVAFANSFLGRWFFAFKAVDIPKDFRVMEIGPNFASGNWRLDPKTKRIVKTTVFFTTNRFQDRLEYVYRRATQVIPQAVAWKAMQPIAGMSGALSFLPLMALTTSTFYPDPNVETTSVDGYFEITGAVWATIRGATASDSVDDSGSPGWFGSYFIAGSYNIRRVMTLFDTSSIPDTDTVSSATLSVYCEAKASPDGPSAYVVSSSPASNTGLVTGDYDQFGTTSFASKAYSSFTTSAYNDFSLDANGIANITATGVSKFGLLDGRDFNNSAPTGNNYIQMSMADNAGTSQDPKLVVIHAAPAVDPNVFETVTVAENLTMMVDENPSVSDDVTVTESVTMMVDENPSVSDDVAVTESVSIDIFGGPEVFDAVTVEESVTVLIEQLVPEVFDAVTVAEVVAVNWELDISVSDDVAVAESVSAESPIDLPAVSDDVAVTESVTVMVSLDPSVNDAVTVTDFSGVTGPVLVAAARDGLIHYRSTEQSQPLMMDEDEVR